MSSDLKHSGSEFRYRWGWLVGFFGSIVCIKLFLALSGVATQQALYIFIPLYSPMLSYFVKLTS